MFDKRRDKSEKFPDLVKLFNDVAANTSRLVEANPWLRGVPYKVLTQAVREIESAPRTNIAKVAKLNAERRAVAGNRRLARFQMHFRSFRAAQCITRHKEA